MKILHLSTQDIGGGGGGFNATFRLHQSMISQGINSKLLVLEKFSNDKDVLNPKVYNLFPNKFLRYFYKIKHLLNIKFHNISPYFYIDSAINISAKNIYKKISFYPDVIMAHWVSGFLSPKHLYEISNYFDAPLLIYLLDNAAMTGGCHYFGDCNNYQKQCGNCPQLDMLSSQNDISSIQFKNKHISFNKINLTALAASTWQKQKLKESSIFKYKRSELVPLGVDTKTFSPINMNSARKKLHLSTKSRIIFFGAMSLGEPRKGFDFFRTALMLLNQMLKKNQFNENILILFAGKNNAPDINIPFKWINLGYLDTDNKLALAYQAADMFICSSIEDAGPMMINESIMCGTPVVAFDMGVAKDLVINGKTGYRVKLKDSKGLAEAMFRLLSANKLKYKKIKINCRNIGLKYCDPKKQVKSIIKICDSLLKNKSI